MLHITNHAVSDVQGFWNEFENKLVQVIDNIQILNHWQWIYYPEIFCYKMNIQSLICNECLVG